MGRRAIESAAKAGRDRQDPALSRRVMTVTQVKGDGTLMLNDGSSDDEKPVGPIRMTTACSGVKAGDRVLVDTISHVSYVIGVLAL